MGQEPAHNSKPMVWQSWAGFSTGLFCQGLKWCTQLDPEGGHWSSISWEPWSGDLEPKGSSQTIFRVVLAVEQHHLRPTFLYYSVVCPICASCCPQSSQSGASSREGGWGTMVLLCQQSRFGWASATAAVPRQSRWEIPKPCIAWGEMFSLCSPRSFSEGITECPEMKGTHQCCCRTQNNTMWMHSFPKVKRTTFNFWLLTFIDF